MSGVTLRCPNCGTMQASEGQCEACHEAAVRYFCLNHEPGLWLEASTCPQCGARHDEPVRSRREASRPVEPSEVRPPLTRRARPPEAEPGPWTTEPAPPTGSAGRTGPDPFSILIGAMTAAARARSERAARGGFEGPLRRRGGGCLGRIFVLILFLAALLLLAPIFLGALLGFR